MNFDRLVKVTEMLVKAAHELLYARDPEDEYFSHCAKITEQFDIEIIQKALSNWVDRGVGLGRLPTGAQLLEQCKYFKNIDPSKPDNRKLQKCCYYSADESELSRSRCSVFVEPELAEKYFRMHGLIVCNWHSLCMQAKSNPEGTEMKLVRNILKSMKNGGGLENNEINYFGGGDQSSFQTCLKNSFLAAKESLSQ